MYIGMICLYVQVFTERYNDYSLTYHTFSERNKKEVMYLQYCQQQKNNKKNNNQNAAAVSPHFQRRKNAFISNSQLYDILIKATYFCLSLKIPKTFSSKLHVAIFLMSYRAVRKILRN
jgi:hypothetical protein